MHYCAMGAMGMQKCINIEYCYGHLTVHNREGRSVSYSSMLQVTAVVQGHDFTITVTVVSILVYVSYYVLRIKDMS